jgi:hypothetical protein
MARSFFKTKPRKGHPHSIKGFAEGLSAMDEALWNMEMPNGGRINRDNPKRWIVPYGPSDTSSPAAVPRWDDINDANASTEMLSDTTSDGTTGDSLHIGTSARVWKFVQINGAAGTNGGVDIVQRDSTGAFEAGILCNKGGVFIDAAEIELAAGTNAKIMLSTLPTDPVDAVQTGIYSQLIDLSAIGGDSNTKVLCIK